jgi:hypothetical protein
MARNFIQNKADVTQYYLNRAKRDDEKSKYFLRINFYHSYIFLDQFKVIDTRRVKVPTRNGKSINNQQNKTELPIERPVQHVSLPSPSNTISSTPPQTSVSQVSKPSSSSSSSIPPINNSQTPTVPPDYRFLLAWSYYLASQAAWLPMLQQQQQGQLPPSLPTDPEAAAKFIQQAMQTAMEPLMTGQTSNNKTTNDDDDDEEQIGSERLFAVKEEANDS